MGFDLGIVGVLLIGVGIFLIIYSWFETAREGFLRYRHRYEIKADKDLKEVFSRIPPRRFFNLNLLSTFSMALVMYLLFSSILLLFIGGAIGFIVPQILLKSAKIKRMKKINIQIIDALGVMKNTMQAGLTLSRACEEVAKQMSPPISQEFAYMMNEFHLGTPLDVALQNMSQRISSKNLNLVIISILISRKTGGNIIDIFDRTAESLRKINELEGKLDSMTAQGKMQGLIMGLLPFFIIYVIFRMDPQLILPLFQTFEGNIMLFVAAFLWANGIFFMWKIINVAI